EENDSRGCSFLPARSVGSFFVHQHEVYATRNSSSEMIATVPVGLSTESPCLVYKPAVEFCYFHDCILHKSANPDGASESRRNGIGEYEYVFILRAAFSGCAS